jgi:lysophospholipase L1-like esterase
MKHIKNFFYYLIIFGFVLLFARGADWFASKYILKNDSSFYTYTPGYYAFATKTGINLTEINSFGIRSKEIEPIKNETRVLFLGDSFTFGGGVRDNDTFVLKSAEALAKKGISIDPINAGIIAYGPSNSLGLFRHLKTKVDPDIVILALYQNDVLDSGESELYKSIRTARKRNALVGLSFFIFPKVSNFFLKRKITNDFQKKIIQFSNPVQKIDDPAAFEKANRFTQNGNSPKKKDFDRVQGKLYLYKLLEPYEENLDIAKNRDKVELWMNNTLDFIEANNVDVVDIVQLLYGLVEPEYFVKTIDLKDEGKQYFENMVSIVDELKSEAERSGMNFGLVLIPSEVMYNPQKQALTQRFNFAIKKEWLESETALEKELENYAKKKKVAFLNLTPGFRNHSDKNLTFEYDLHLNEKGHQLAADFISEFLSKSFQIKTKK